MEGSTTGPASIEHESPSLISNALMETFNREGCYPRPCLMNWKMKHLGRFTS